MNRQHCGVTRASVTLYVNGREEHVQVEARTTLLEVLREQLGLTGAKEGCGVGECGACTVLVDGQPVKSCLVLAVRVGGRHITTIEGLGGPERLHPLQESFLRRGAFQCGFCTPGMILAGSALLAENPEPSEDEIREALVGHLCRCTGYLKIIEAVRDAAGHGKGGAHEAG